MEERRLTWIGSEAGLKCSWLGGDGGTRALHGDGLHGAGMGEAGGGPLLPLQGLLDGDIVRGQVGQLVEHVTLTDDGIDQVTVTCVHVRMTKQIKQTKQINKQTKALRF